MPTYVPSKIKRTIPGQPIGDLEDLEGLPVTKLTAPDLDTVTDHGEYIILSAATHGPPGVTLSNGYLHVFDVGGGGRHQWLQSNEEDSVYARHYDGSSWSAWSANLFAVPPYEDDLFLFILKSRS